MRAVIQRVSEASVRVDGETVGKIGKGYLVLLCVMDGDTENEAAYIAKKIFGLRVFEDAEGKMNLSISDVGGSVLLVSQFTLAGDVRHGNRPAFITAARPDKAEPLFLNVAGMLIDRGLRVETGRFRTHMEVSLINDGPVTILLDSEKTF